MPFFLVILIGVCEQDLYELAVVGINAIVDDLTAATNLATDFVGFEGH